MATSPDAVFSAFLGTNRFRGSRAPGLAAVLLAGGPREYLFQNGTARVTSTAGHDRDWVRLELPAPEPPWEPPPASTPSSALLQEMPCLRRALVEALGTDAVASAQSLPRERALEVRAHGAHGPGLEVSFSGAPRRRPLSPDARLA